MKFLAAMAVALSAMTMAGSHADAVITTQGVLATDLSQGEFGPALPPIGFVRFCADNKIECSRSATRAGLLRLAPEQWHALYVTNRSVNSQISPVSDMQQYGEIERWALPVSKGDCEDYALLKRKKLLDLGFSADSLRLTVVLDEQGEGHAVLTIVTESGDYVLDNRRDDILRSAETHYKFLKRQSGSDPRKWVALTKQQPRTSGSVATPAAQK